MIGHIPAGLLGAIVPVALVACTGRFDFDIPDEAGSAGAAAAVSWMGEHEGAEAGAGSTTESSALPAVETLDACDSRCAALGALCAPEWLACVECNRDDDCAAGRLRRCDSVLHRCVECGVDADCGVHKRCDPERRTCVAACNDADGDAVCTDPASVCDMERRVCVVCDSDASCAASPSGPYCTSTGTRCAECLLDTHCPLGTPYCDPVLLECVACRDSRDCGGTGCGSETHACS